VVDVVNAIRSGKEVIAMCAPATEGQFGEDISMASIRNACKELGFADMVEVGLGGDMTAAYEAEEWAEALEEGRNLSFVLDEFIKDYLDSPFEDVFDSPLYKWAVLKTDVSTVLIGVVQHILLDGTSLYSIVPVKLTDILIA
jgi:hypothetical protein